MARLSRAFQYLFGRDGDSSHFGQFGSRASAAGFTTKDPNTIQALTAFINNGWKDAIIGAKKTPALEDMNGLFYLLFYQICYGFQEGVPEWDSGTTYYTNGIVKKPGTLELYGSLTDGNTGNSLPSRTDNAFWKYLNPSSYPAGTVIDYAGATIPVGFIACDGTVYAQATYPDLYAAIGSYWNVGGEGAGNFRVPNLGGRATIGGGSGFSTTPRFLGTYLGEEAITLGVGEIPAHAHAVTDPGHHHGTDPAGNNFMVSGPNNDAGIPFSSSPQFSRNKNQTGDASTGISIQDTGGSGAHNNMQPSAVVLKLIKT